MPTFYQTSVATRRTPARVDAGPCSVSMRAVFPVTAALGVGDVIEALVLPADCVLVNAVLDASDLDSHNTPALAYDVGLMSGAVGLKSLNRTVGAELFSGATVGQAAGIAETSLRTALAQMAADRNRSIGIKITTAAATAVVSGTDGTNFRGFWEPNTAYASGDYITLPNGLRVACTTAGTSGAVMPIESFSSAVKGGTVSDGTVTWTHQDPYLGLTVTYRSVDNGL